jgi:hypothetical protein
MDLRDLSFALMAIVMFAVPAAATFGVIYVAVRLAIRHERKNLN